MDRDIKDLLSKCADQFGTPAYCYALDGIRSQAARIREAFSNRFALSYAVKSNPNPSLLAALREIADKVDVSSGGEIELALAAGWSAGQISFTGPGKTRSELEQAVKADIEYVIVESLDEARLLDEACAATGASREILLRISPKKMPRGFGINMAGKPTQFGIDEEEIEPAMTELTRLKRLALKGFHIYSGTQCLQAEAVVENLSIFTEIFRSVCTRHDITPDCLIFGSGFGIPYHENDLPLDLEEVAAGTMPVLDALQDDDRFRSTKLVLELGRFLIGESGFFLTRVIRIKESRGASLAICDGGMHHHLAACGHLGSVLHRNYRISNLSAELRGNGPAERKYELVGPLCTSIDTLGHGVALPETRIGDVLLVESSGAYGLSSSPIHFISHSPPVEILVDSSKKPADLRDISHFRGHIRSA